MIARCFNPNCKNYKNYGARGIKVCDEWLNSDNFIKWALNNGYEINADHRKECSLDRIDVNGNYEPSNCRWTDFATQSNNRRNNHRVDYKDKSYTVAELSRKFNINDSTLSSRLIDKRMSVEDAVNSIKYKTQKEQGKPVALIDDKGNILKTFNSAKVASELLGIKYHEVSRVCSGERKSTFGMRFKYI